jgi:hypothetical protein
MIKPPIASVIRIDGGVTWAEVVDDRAAHQRECG